MRAAKEFFIELTAIGRLSTLAKRTKAFRKGAQILESQKIQLKREQRLHSREAQFNDNRLRTHQRDFEHFGEQQFTQTHITRFKWRIL